jgi:hypothetical protein
MCGDSSSHALLGRFLPRLRPLSGEALFLPRLGRIFYPDFTDDDKVVTSIYRERADHNYPWRVVAQFRWRRAPRFLSGFAVHLFPRGLKPADCAETQDFSVFRSAPGHPDCAGKSDRGRTRPLPACHQNLVPGAPLKRPATSEDPPTIKFSGLRPHALVIRCLGCKRPLGWQIAQPVPKMCILLMQERNE